MRLTQCSVSQPARFLYLFCHYLDHTIDSAALSPWEGINALDAAVLAYTNVSALRQQLKPTVRVHGIFEGKDWATNSVLIRSFILNLILISAVIPDYAKYL